LTRAYQYPPLCDRRVGHVRALVAPNGAITEVWHYDSWGNPISPPAERIDQPFTWNGAYGYEYIPFTGLYHVGAREYDPRTARWLQKDPIDAASGDPNLYRYCGNAPVNWTDPDGQKIMIVTIYDDFIGALPDALAGDLIGGGGGLLYALSFQNKPTRTGYARLGRANPSARYG
jgi:RHS repeat-associated protein